MLGSLGNRLDFSFFKSEPLSHVATMQHRNMKTSTDRVYHGSLMKSLSARYAQYRSFSFINLLSMIGGMYTGLFAVLNFVPQYYSLLRSELGVMELLFLPNFDDDCKKCSDQKHADHDHTVCQHDEDKEVRINASQILKIFLMLYCPCSWKEN